MTHKGWIYDVFVSFHGEDTRYSFTGYLCNALEVKGIHTFKDDKKLKKGKGISPSLVRAIEGSRIAIIVFSENYASSTWCLDELVKIMECMDKKGQLVMPVFYYVDPSDVRHQRGSFGKSMNKHEANPENGKDRASKWRIALKEAANLAGWHFKNGYEFELIQGITEEISSILNITSLHIADHPVGLKYRMTQVVKLLGTKSNDDDVIMVGIYGIGGIGKTTIARAVYNSISSKFECSSFLSDVRENSMKHGLVQLQETLLFHLLGENLKLDHVNQGIPIIKRRLSGKKVLLILDDVDNLKQLRSLAGKPDWFGPGSRIIITTRDKHVLVTHGVEKIYEVKELNDNEALELFSLNAFRRSKPDAAFAEIANRVVQYAKGLPLALNVIGSDLFGKTIEEWSSALRKYERIPSREILDVLRVSYENLDDNEKEIFLDIACFFKGNLRQDVEKTLIASNFFPEYGIGVLVDKSLVTISETDAIKMHDLIQDLGRDIARNDSPFNPGKRRRLWHPQDVLEVLAKNTGSDEIEGIMLDMTNLKQEVQLNANTFENMRRLRILIVRNAKVSGAPKHLPNNLRVLDWNEFPLSSLPADFHPEELVILKMPHSHLTFDEPLKKFEHLTVMNLSDSKTLTRLPDVSATPNLMKLLVNNCPNLVEIHDSVGHLSKLVTFSAGKCPKLESFPSGLRSKSLEYLNLRDSSSIQSFPDVLAKVESMKNIDIGGTAIKKFPNSIENFNSLEELVLRSCENLEDLPTNTNIFRNIEDLNVEGCPQLQKLLWKSLQDRTESLPKLSRLTLKKCDLSDEDLELILSCFLELKWLILSDNNFVTIPESIEDLSHLLLLHVDNCKKLRNISVLPTYLQYIDARNCISLTPQSSEVILSQAFQEVEYMDIVVLRTKIPNWFDHCRKGKYVDFWIRQKFPTIAIFFLLGGKDEKKTDHTCEFYLLINDLQVFQGKREWPIDHVWLFDLRIHLTASEWHNINERIKSGWNHVRISCSVLNETENVTVKCCGIHLYKDRMNIHHVSFINPDLHGSNAAYDEMNGSLDDIYDESSNDDVVLPNILSKYFTKNIVELMEDLQSGKRKGDHYLLDFDDDLEQDSDTEIQDREEEQHSIPERCEIANNEKETDANSQQLFEAFVTIADEKEQMHQKKGKLKEDGNEPDSSTNIASTSKNNITQLSDEFTFAEQINDHNKSKQTPIIQVEPNAEIFHTDSAERTYYNFQQSLPYAENKTSIVELECSIHGDNNMEAFYAFLDAENPSWPYLQHNQADTESTRTRPSEKTQENLQTLRDLIAKKFSLLLHPGRSGLMKDILKYLLNSPPEEGVSLRTKSLILQLLTSFAQWSLDYNNASLKLESTTSELSRSQKVKEELEANVKDFKEVKMVENFLCTKLESLEEKKRELEEEINAIKGEIADLRAERETVVKRKREVFVNGRVLNSEREGLRNRIPRLKAEQEGAKVTLANIEQEWLKLAEQVIGSTSFDLTKH